MKQEENPTPVVWPSDVVRVILLPLASEKLEKLKKKGAGSMKTSDWMPLFFAQIDDVTYDISKFLSTLKRIAIWFGIPLSVSLTAYVIVQIVRSLLGI